MWLTAGHMVPSLTTCRQLNNFNEERRASFSFFHPSFLPSPPPCLFSFFLPLPSPPSGLPYKAGSWSWPLRKTPLGPGYHLSSLNMLSWSRLMWSAAATSQKSPPFRTKPVTLARKCTTSITVTLQSPASPLSQLLSLVWSIYSPSVCLKHTSHSRGKLISPSLPSLLSLSFSLLLPPTLAICHEQLLFSHLKFSMTLKIDCTHTPGHGER